MIHSSRIVTASNIHMKTSHLPAIAEFAPDRHNRAPQQSLSTATAEIRTSLKANRGSEKLRRERPPASVSATTEEQPTPGRLHRFVIGRVHRKSECCKFLKSVCAAELRK
jgi:hypothetical protein